MFLHCVPVLYTEKSVKFKAKKKNFVNAFEVGNTCECVIPAPDEQNIGKGLNNKYIEKRAPPSGERGR